MIYLEKMHTLQRLHTLIARRGTGSREALAARLGVSERTVYRLLGALEGLGASIAYDQERGTYYYTNRFELKIHVIVVIDGEEYTII